MIGKIAKKRKEGEVNVVAINQFGGFSVKKDTDDGSHPNVIGAYKKIASKYFSELKRSSHRRRKPLAYAERSSNKG